MISGTREGVVVMERSERAGQRGAQAAFDAQAAALRQLERRLIGGAKRAQQLEHDLLPAWLRPSEGEHRWPMGVAVGAAICLQLTLPPDLAIRPRFVLPSLEANTSSVSIAT